MAGKVPSFITGANAKLKVDGVTLAFATDLSYQAKTTHVPVEVFGVYEVKANEPVAFHVQGSFTVVRYAQSAASQLNVRGANSSGNGIGNWIGTANNNSIATDKGNSRFFNPRKILMSKTVDITVYRRTANELTANEQVFLTIKDCRITNMTTGINKRGVAMTSYTFVGELYQDASFEASNSGHDDITG